MPFTANVLYFLIQAFIPKAPTFPKAEKEDVVQEQEQQRKGKKERKGKGKICIATLTRLAFGVHWEGIINVTYSSGWDTKIQSRLPHPPHLKKKKKNLVRFLWQLARN